MSKPFSSWQSTCVHSFIETNGSNTITVFSEVLFNQREIDEHNHTHGVYNMYYDKGDEGELIIVVVLAIEFAFEK